MANPEDHHAALLQIAEIFRDLLADYRTMKDIVGVRGKLNKIAFAGIEAQVNTTLGNLRDALAQINFNFDDIDPGDMDEAVKAKDVNARVRTVTDRRKYWDDLLGDQTKPWAQV